MNLIPIGYCQCGCGGKTDLAPNTSRRNGWIKGQPLKFIRFHHAKVQHLDGPSAYERVMSRVVKLANGCWDAGPSTGKNWYGQVSFNGKNVKAHQVVWERYYGPVPKGKVIRHTCDNMRCCRRGHLKLGSVADNVADAVKRGRIQKGVDRYNAKLTESKVRKILSSDKSADYLSRKYGVSKSTIYAVQSRRIWRHVQ